MTIDLVDRLALWAAIREAANGDEPRAGKIVRTGWLREAIAALERPSGADNALADRLNVKADFLEYGGAEVSDATKAHTLMREAAAALRAKPVPADREWKPVCARCGKPWSFEEHRFCANAPCDALLPGGIECAGFRGVPHEHKPKSALAEPTCPTCGHSVRRADRSQGVACFYAVCTGDYQCLCEDVFHTSGPALAEPTCQLGIEGHSGCACVRGTLPAPRCTCTDHTMRWSGPRGQRGQHHGKDCAFHFDGPAVVELTCTCSASLPGPGSHHQRRCAMFAVADNALADDLDEIAGLVRDCKFVSVQKLQRIWDAVATLRATPPALPSRERIEALRKPLWNPDSATATIANCIGWNKAIDAVLALAPALAQQAQPLTDEMIEAECDRRESGAEQIFFMAGAKWARDRMAQQTQPEPCSCVIKHGSVVGASHRFDCNWGVGGHGSQTGVIEIGDRRALAQQAQPLCEHGETTAHSVQIYDGGYSITEPPDFTGRCPGPQQAQPEPALADRERIANALMETGFLGDKGVGVIYALADAVLALKPALAEATSTHDKCGDCGDPAYIENGLWWHEEPQNNACDHPAARAPGPALADNPPPCNHGTWMAVCTKCGYRPGERSTDRDVDVTKIAGWCALREYDPTNCGIDPIASAMNQAAAILRRRPEIGYDEEDVARVAEVIFGIEYRRAVAWTKENARASVVDENGFPDAGREKDRMETMALKVIAAHTQPPYTDNASAVYAAALANDDLKARDEETGCMHGATYWMLRAKKAEGK